MKNPALNILPIEKATGVANELRHNGKVIVLTNGCFDLLHVGHLECLTLAKGKGDVLFVGLNHDESVRRIKGECRPIIPMEMRAQLLVSLRVVDYVVPFVEDTALQVVKAVRPDIYVKGSDYNLLATPEGAEVVSSGGTVQSLELIPSISTTLIIEKIKQKYCSPNRGTAPH